MRDLLRMMLNKFMFMHWYSSRLSQSFTNTFHSSSLPLDFFLLLPDFYFLPPSLPIEWVIAKMINLTNHYERQEMYHKCQLLPENRLLLTGSSTCQTLCTKHNNISWTLYENFMVFTQRLFIWLSWLVK